MLKNKGGRTVFRVIVVPLMVVFIFIVLLVVGMLHISGIFTELDSKSERMFFQQISSRSNYLFDEFNDVWSDLDSTADSINSIVQLRLNSGEIVLEDLNDLSASVDILDEIDESLVDVIHTNNVTGAYVIFNTDDLDKNALENNLPGLYYRTLDPKATDSNSYENIFIERAPEAIADKGILKKDDGWQSSFLPEDSSKQDYFYKPFMAAFNSLKKLAAEEYGYWTTSEYTLTGDDRCAISYSIPLILEDGTVYGVLGVELLSQYILTYLPYQGLLEGDGGSYLIAVSSDNSQTLKPVLFAGSSTINNQVSVSDRFSLQSIDGGEIVDTEGVYFVASILLDVYEDDSPYSNDKWYLVGLAEKDELFAFTGKVRNILFLSALIAIVLGLTSIGMVSYKFSKPIRKLSNEVSKFGRNNEMPVLSNSGILEIDQFAASITKLGSEVIKSSTRLLNIIDMASVEIGGYEIQEDSEYVFVTKNFFPMLGVYGVDTTKLLKSDFTEKFEFINRKLQSETGKGEVIYSVPQSGGGMRYCRYEVKHIGQNYFGLLEDVTKAVMEKRRIEHERDCDGLTGLYNGQGFRRMAKSILLKPVIAKHAALLMMDLDNLKVINDTYGHGFGDKYIKAASRCFDENIPSGDLCARISGDEFTILFHGYDSKDEIREKISGVYDAIRRVCFKTPEGDTRFLSVSGGVAFFPDETTDLATLLKYADFAMYQSKMNKRGTYCEFDYGVYRNTIEKNQMKSDFNQLIENRNVKYHFQPIFSSTDASVFAYEALMRVDIPSLRSPLKVIDMARETNRLNDIEEITMFCSAECFKKLMDKKQIYPGAKLFVNSLANAVMSEESENRYNELYNDLQKDIVVEITESEHLDVEYLERKRKAKGFNGMFALDDFGSGYNNEINLLELNPQYIKLDISIVRDIDTNADKQKLVSHFIQYAHEKNMIVVAEGIETEGELREVLSLGADLLQGYFLALPNETPGTMSMEALKVIKDFWNN